MFRLTQAVEKGIINEPQPNPFVIKVLYAAYTHLFAHMCDRAHAQCFDDIMVHMVTGIAQTEQSRLFLIWCIAWSPE